MLRVLIADDEPLFREYLLKIIDWNDLGFEISAICKDGKEVYEQLENGQFDLLILDINMPHLTGLELTRIARSKKDSPEIIFSTGYSEFEYAKQAINLGVFEYLLKPFSKDELISVLKKVIVTVTNRNEHLAEIKRKDKEVQHKLIESLIYQENAIKPLELQWLSNLFETSSYFNCLVFKSERSIFTSFLVDKIMIRLRKYVVAERIIPIVESEKQLSIILGFQEERDVKSIEGTSFFDVIDLLGDKTFVLGIGRTVTINQINQSHDSALKAIERKFLMPSQVVFTSSSQKASVLELFRKISIYEELPVIFRKQSSEQLDNFFNEIENKIIEENYTLSQVKEVVDHIVMINNLYTDQYHIDNFIDIIDLNEYENLNHLMCFLKESLFKTIIDVGNTRSLQSLKLANKIEVFIKKNYSNPSLNMDFLASIFHLDSSHIRRVFQREFHCTPNEYLTKIRMEEAKRLLNTGKYTITEVTFEIGYKDASYFSKVFKKFCGESPKYYLN